MLLRILLIARRDYVAAVFTKGFVLSLLVPILLPLGAGIVGGGVATMVQKGGSARRVALVDHTGLDAAAAVVRMHKQPRADRSSSGYDDNLAFEIARAADGTALAARVRNGELFGILELESGDRAVLRTIAGSGSLAYREIFQAIDRGMREVRLRQSGLDQTRFAAVVKPVSIDFKGIDDRKEDLGRSMIQSMMIPGGLMLMMLFTVINASAGMLTGVAEDKKERVFEMMLASATPLEIMAGKVAGSVLVALTSSLVWILYALAALSFTGTIGLAPLRLLPWFICFLTCELMMLSAASAAIGAATSAPAEAQRFSTVLLLPLSLPLFVLSALLDQSNSTWALVLSMLPPVAPMVMLVRQALPAGVPLWQPWAALAVMSASTCLLTWIASRIFRIGLLTQGTRTNWADVARWALRG